MSSIEQDIAGLRAAADRQGRAVAQAEQQVSIHQGLQDAALADLKTEFGVGSIDEAKDKASRVEAALAVEVEKMRRALAQAGGQE